MRSRFRQSDQEQIAEKLLDVDASMQGTLSFNDPVNLRINGKFEGKLCTKGNLLIGENADVSAEILGESITIAGKVRGSIRATKELKLISPAIVIGSVITPVLSIAEGALIDGNIKMSVARSSGQLLSMEEVAKYLEIEQDIVSEWADNGKLPGIKEGNIWRFDKTVLENWVSNEKIN